MFKKIAFFVCLCATSAVFAQLAGALPADRLAFAKELAKRGMHREALAEYEAIRNEPSLPKDELDFRLGETYRRLGRTEEARARYRNLIATAPESKYAAYARLNEALLAAGPERTTALKSLDNPSTPPAVRAAALYHLGENALESGDSKTAAECFRKVPAIAGDDETARLARIRLASILAAAPTPEERRSALAIYLDVAAGKDKTLAPEALFLAGMLSYRDSRHTEATALFNRLIQNFPESPRANEARIYAAWSNHLAGRHSEALKVASPLRAENSEDAHYLTAAALRKQERRQDALAAYDETLAKFPNGKYAAAAWFERLSTLAAMNEHAKVLETLRNRKNAPPDYEVRAWSLGCDAAIATTNFPLAVEYARLVAKRRDGELAPNAVHRLAWLFEKMQDWPRAAKAYRGMANEWPKHKNAAQALFQAGAAEARSGRPDQARADWTTLLARYPDSKFAPEALYARAMEEIRKQEYRAAAASLDELSARFPNIPKKAEVHYWAGVAANGIDDRQAAEKHFRAALNEKPNAEFEREIKLELAFTLARGENKTGAAEIFAALLHTKSAERIPSGDLQWLAETMLETANHTNAAYAAGLIEQRDNGPQWNQIGACLAALAHDAAGETDAALAAYRRALEQPAQTEYAIRAALGLGRLETRQGLFDDAKTHLSEAVDRARAKEYAAYRIRAYAALAFNEEERGDANAALGYHMLIGTLFDDPEHSPEALEKAAAILKKQGKAKEAEQLLKEKSARYPAAK